MAVVRIVDRPTPVGINVALDLSPGASGLQLGPGFDAPPPPLRRSVSDNTLTDGGVVAASAFGLRTVTLPLTYPAVVGGSMTLRAAAVTALVRALEAGGYLEVTSEGSASPRYLRFFPSADAAMTAKLTLQRSASVVVTLLAEPFAYGQMQDLGNWTMTLDPAAATPFQMDMGSTILGDVETPLLLSTPDVSKVGTTQNSVYNTVFAMYRGTPATLPGGFVYQLGAGINNTSAVADATASGGSLGRVDFTALPALLPRWQGSKALPAVGDYRVLLVYRKSVATDVHTARFDYSIGGGATPNVPLATVTLPALQSPTQWHVADLGVFTHPAGGNQHPLGLTANPVNAATADFQLEVGRTSGTGTFDGDYLLFLPAMTSQLWTSHPGSSSEGPSLYAWDGINESFWSMKGSTDPFSATQSPPRPVSLSGGWPMLLPGAPSNSLIVLPKQLVLTSGTFTAGGITISETFTLNPRYWPRYLSHLQ